MILLDEYTETGSLSRAAIDAVGDYFGQSFKPDYTTQIERIDFYLNKAGTPTGNVRVHIYGHTGTYGGNSARGFLPVLAQSDTLDISAISTTAGFVSFSFSGSNRITLYVGQPYVISVSPDAGASLTGANNIGFYIDYATVTHDGCNLISTNSGATWSGDSTGDAPFRAYGVDLPSTAWFRA